MIFDLVINLVLTFLLAIGLNVAPANFPADPLLFGPKPEATPIPWESTASASAAVLSGENNLFIFTHQADLIRPIASISKLMTALVFLDHNPGWEEIYEIRPQDRIEGGRLNLFWGERLTIKDLFYTSLIASDNGATLALVSASGLSEEEFVAKMNAKARHLGLLKTSFADPVGLSEQNLSTAREVAILAGFALAVSEIRTAVGQATYEFNTINGRDKKIESTDYLLFSDAENVIGGKTGYTDSAGYCYVGEWQDEVGRSLIVAVLGASDRNSRFTLSRDLATWALKSYDWSGRSLIRK